MRALYLTTEFNFMQQWDIAAGNSFTAKLFNGEWQAEKSMHHWLKFIDRIKENVRQSTDRPLFVITRRFMDKIIAQYLHEFCYFRGELENSINDARAWNKSDEKTNFGRAHSRANITTIDQYFHWNLFFNKHYPSFRMHFKGYFMIQEMQNLNFHFSWNLFN